MTIQLLFHYDVTVTCNGIDCSFMYVTSVYYNLNNNDDNESSAAPLHICSRWVLTLSVTNCCEFTTILYGPYLG